MSIPVSLVITTYNRERYLGAAIASVLAQTYPHFELLVWDDGSTDNSLAIAREYADRDRRVRVVAASHQGRLLALKMALAATSGTYLGWVDSDDLLAPTALAETVGVLAAQPATGWVYTDYVDLDEGGRPLHYGFRCQIPYSPERLLVDFMTFHFRLMRRSVFEQVSGIDLALEECEDYDISLRLSEQSPVAHIAQPLYLYRRHPQSLSNQHPQKQRHWSQVAIQRALERRGLSDRLQIDLEGDRFILRSRKLRLSPWHACLPSWLPRPVGTVLAGLSLLGLGVREAQALVAPTPGQLKQGTVTTQPSAGLRPSAPAARSTIPDLPEIQPRFAETSPLALQLAQAIQPASDGTGTVVNQAGDQFDITGGQRSDDQTNLFHSFEQFNLSAEQTAIFLSQPEIQNIVGRVVGGDPSLLNGLLQVVGGPSNLFLLNPAGLLVGPNMQLDIPGSLTLTSANAIGFGDQWWQLDTSTDFSLLNGAPTGFTFLANSPSPVVNTGNLTVSPGQAVRLMGGTVVNTGTITAPGGEITLSAVPGSSTLRISQPGQLLSLEIEASALAGGSLPVTSLPQLLTGAFPTPGLGVNAMGQAVLSAGDVVIPEGQVAAVAGQLDTSSSNGEGGTVAVLGDRVGLFNATLDASGETGGGQIFIGGGYQGQGPVPNASRTIVDSGTTLVANALTRGDGGQVFVWADGATSFLGDLEIRGGAEAGNGGFAEVSGREFLDYRGRVDAQAAHGVLGTLLLDPTNIEIVGSGYDTTDLSSVDEFSDPDLDPVSQRTRLAVNSINNAFANVVLQATNNITFEADVVMNGFGYDLSATAGNRIDVNADITLSGGNFVANSAVFNSEGGTITNEFGGIQITTTGGDITLGAIDGNAANVVLQSANNIAFNGDVNLVGAGYGLSATAINRIDVNADMSLSGGNFVANSAVFDSAGITMGGLGTQGSTFQITTLGGDIILGAINNANVGLQSTNNITLDGEVNLVGFGYDFVATAGNRLEVDDDITLNNGDFTASSATFNSVGNTIATNGGDLRLTTTGGDLNTGILDTSIVSIVPEPVFDGTVTAGNAGRIDLTSAANIATGDLRAISQAEVFGDSVTATSGTGGDIAIVAPGAVTVNGTIQTSSIAIALDDSEPEPLITGPFTGPTGPFTGPSLLTAIANGDSAGDVNIQAGGNLTVTGPIVATAAATATDEVGGVAEATTGRGGNIFLRSGGSGVVNTIDTSTSATADSVETPEGVVSSASAAAGPGGGINILAGANLTLGNLDAIATAIASGAPASVTAPTASAGITLTTGQTLQVGNVNTSSALSAGGPIAITSQAGNVSTGDLNASGLTQGGNVAVQAATGLTTGAINSSSEAGSGGSVTLGPARDITTGDINTSGSSRGGNVTVSASQSIAAGQISTRSALGNGGNVTLDPLGDIEVSFIDAQGGLSGLGGTVDITTARFFRATGSFVDQNGIRASISTAGGEGGGPITIRHGGGLLGTPFTVGTGVTSPNGNGTAGAITTGQDNTIDAGSFPETYVQGENPSIQIITQNQDDHDEDDYDELLIPLQGEVVPTITPTETLPPLTQAPIKTIDEARDILRQVENATGIKPALIYVQFVQAPPGAAPNGVKSEVVSAPAVDNPAVETLQADPNSTYRQQEARYTQQFESHLALPNTPTSAPVTQQAETDQLELMVITADGPPVWKRVNVSRAEVLATARLFRLEVADSRKVWTRSYEASAKQLYQWVIDPIQGDLESLGIGNLTFVADGGLRSLPWAALYDGQQFLIESYSVGLMPSLSLADTRFVDIRQAEVLAGGAETFDTLADLPAVPKELELLSTLWGAQVLKNDEFTFERLRQQRQQTPYGIVHLATHGEFQAGRPQNSFIQLTDTRLQLDQLRQMGWNNPPLELLVLSACRTALGDEEAELGFAGLALQAGVKSTLASLWYVSDVGTLALMTEFYRQLETAPQATLKAEALRQAQLALLTKTVTLDQTGALVLPGIAEPIALGPDISGIDTANLSHPFYWAAFTMAGNPW